MRVALKVVRTLGVREEELKPLSAGFAGFCAALAGYFLLLPLRDEAGVSLGTDKLPRLFVASLLVTFIATPLASYFLSRSPTKEQGLQLLFRCLSLSILGFLLLYSMAGAPAPPESLLPLHGEGATALSTHSSIQATASGAASGSSALPGVADQHMLREQEQEQEARRSRHLLTSEQAAAVPGAVPLTRAQAAVRVAFFLWVSLLNLVAVSTLWARSADVFTSEAAGRLFGLLGAGATLGQLLGSLAAGVLARAPLLGGGGGSPSLLPLLASAAMLELAGQAVGRYKAPRTAAAAAAAAAAATLPAAAMAVDADVLASPGPGATGVTQRDISRLLRQDSISGGSSSLLRPSRSAGASLGKQGSFSSASLIWHGRPQGPVRHSSFDIGASPSKHNMLAGGKLKSDGGDDLHSDTEAGGGGGICDIGSGVGGLGASTQRFKSHGASRQGIPLRARPYGLLDQLLGRTLEGYRLIMASPYLLHMCAYLALNYITSSFFYFEKTLVVATVPDAASRTAWFATINSTSASVILGLQLVATGRVLRFLGLPIALSILPATAGFLMGLMAVRPAPSTVALAEVLRKVLSYSLARPARESLFTVVTREEKYKAKIFLDTVVQRIGDTMAAAAFQTLVPSLGFGPAGVAAACIPVCAAWAIVAYRLGLRQQRLAAALGSDRPTAGY